MRNDFLSRISKGEGVSRVEVLFKGLFWGLGNSISKAIVRGSRFVVAIRLPRSEDNFQMGGQGKFFLVRT